MRVTSQSLSTQIIEDMQQAYQRLASAQEVATTGLKINSLSDDPRGATQALGLLSFQSSLDQYQRNINSAQPLLQQQDSVLGDVVNGLTQAKQIALQAANSINTPAEQQAAAAQIQQIFSQLLADANTSVGNRFLFGGFLSGAAPFAQGANGVSYLGDNGNVTIQTSPTSSLSTNLPGSQVFQGAGVDGGVGIFDVLQDLQTILQGNGASNALNLAVNLDSRIAAGSGFSPPDAVGTEATPGTFTGEANYSTTVTVFDSQGQAHNLTLLFAKTGAATFK